MNGIDPVELENFFKERKTYEDIRIILQGRYPGERGFSTKSIKRFCKKNGLSPRISQTFVDNIVSNGVEQVSSYKFVFK